MQNKLDQNQIGKLREKFREHPLLDACCKAFGCYEADLQYLLFAPEEIFLEAAFVIDEILGAPENAEAYVNGLWNSLKIKIRRWENGVPQDELNLVVGAVFYVAAAVFIQHWHSFFRDTIKDKLLKSAQKNMGISADEEQRVIKVLASCAEDLREWLNGYAESDEWLSDEIAGVLAADEEIPMSNETNTAVFDYKLNEAAIAETIRGIRRNGMGEVNFAYAVHCFFESIKWLSNKIETRFVAWMKENGLMTVRAKNLKQARPDDSRVRALISDMKNIFQEKHPMTDKWRDKKEFYLPNKLMINDGI